MFVSAMNWQQVASDIAVLTCCLMRHIWHTYAKEIVVLYADRATGQGVQESKPWLAWTQIHQEADRLSPCCF